MYQTLPIITRDRADRFGATMDDSHAVVWVSSDGQRRYYLGHGASPEAALADAREGVEHALARLGGSLVVHRIV